MKFYATRAKKALEEAILSRWVQVEIVDRDRYQRIVAIIKNEKDETINLNLVFGGFAIARYGQSENPKGKYYYPKYEKLLLALKKAQDEAKKNKLNIWEIDINRIYSFGFGRKFVH
ncbi:thermonuclease family protein [Mycoplasma sp. 'Moose RK']|nr:thermonuclease family protein [Mycoplasma sp. 'Moose RK']